MVVYLLVIIIQCIENSSNLFSFPRSYCLGSIWHSRHTPSAHLTATFFIPWHSWLFSYSSFVSSFWASAMLPCLAQKTRVKMGNGMEGTGLPQSLTESLLWLSDHYSEACGSRNRMPAAKLAYQTLYQKLMPINLVKLKCSETTNNLRNGYSCILVNVFSL